MKVDVAIIVDEKNGDDALVVGDVVVDEAKNKVVNGLLFVVVEMKEEGDGITVGFDKSATQRLC